MRYYHTGKGQEPFVFEYGGKEYVINPPDQKWDRIPEWYEVQPKNGPPQRFQKFRWEIAEKQPKRLPQNFLDVTEDMHKFLQTGKFAKFRGYIKTSKELGQELDQLEDTLVSRHDAKIEDIKQKQAEEIERLKEDHAARVKELKQTTLLRK